MSAVYSPARTASRSWRIAHSTRLDATEPVTYPLPIIAEAMLNGLLTGAVYALIALGLTLVYGVLHIINFAHGALLTAAMFAVWAIHSFMASIPISPSCR